MGILTACMSLPLCKQNQQLLVLWCLCENPIKIKNHKITHTQWNPTNGRFWYFQQLGCKLSQAICNRDCQITKEKKKSSTENDDRNWHLSQSRNISGSKRIIKNLKKPKKYIAHCFLKFLDSCMWVILPSTNKKESNILCSPLVTILEVDSVWYGMTSLAKIKAFVPWRQRKEKYKETYMIIDRIYCYFGIEKETIHPILRFHVQVGFLRC